MEGDDDAQDFLQIFECSFCEEKTFESESKLDQHLLHFHRISKKKISKTLRKELVISPNQKSSTTLTKTPKNLNIFAENQKIIPIQILTTFPESENDRPNADQIGYSNPAMIQNSSTSSEFFLPNSNKKYQCYVCALDFYECDILSFHLEKVHGIVKNTLGAQIKIEKLAFSADDSPYEGNFSSTVLLTLTLYCYCYC